MGEDKMFEFITVRELYELVFNADHIEKDNIEYVELQGWVKTNRDNGSLGFIEFNDGTYFKNAQLVYFKDSFKDYDTLSKYGTGTALTVMGKLVFTPDAKQPFEIQIKEVRLEGECASDYPMQKKRHSFEYLREIPHLRVHQQTARLYTLLYFLPLDRANTNCYRYEDLHLF